MVIEMIIYTGGKTAGHIYPLLELIKYQNLDNVLYIGLSNSLEEKLCKDRGISFLGLTLNSKTDYYKEFKRISEIDFDLVVSSGGFVSFPTLLVCRFKKIKYILLEENMCFGLTNSIFKRQAYKVCLTFKMEKMRRNYIVTFNPVVERKVDLNKYKSNKYRILVLAGSLGSKVMCDIADKIAVVKKEDEEIVVVSKNHKPSNTQIKYYGYIDDLPSLVASSDFVISRAGSGSVCELLALHKKTLLIPAKTKRNHQLKNAKYLDSINAMSYLTEEEFSVNKYLKIKNYKSNKVSSIVIYDSGKKINDIIMEALDVN